MKFRLVESKPEYLTNEEILEFLYSCENIIMFEKANGDIPVEDFILSIQDSKLQSEVLYDIQTLNRETYKVKPPLSSYVADGIYELRSKSRNNITRVFYFFIYGNNIVLTNGYVKKQQKLDRIEFEKAKRYRDEFNREEH